MANGQPQVTEAERQQLRQAVMDELRRRGVQVAPEIPPVIGQEPPVSGLSELTGGIVSRPNVVGMGAAVGGAAGTVLAAPTTPAGQVAAGAAGATLGAGAGESVFQNTEDAAEALGIITRPQVPTPTERIESIGEEMKFEAMFSLAAPVIKPVVAARKLIGRVFGVNSDEARRVLALAELNDIRVPEQPIRKGPFVRTREGIARTTQETAEALGIRGAARGPVAAVGAADVGNDFIRAIQNATAVFPVTGTPARRALGEKSQALVRRTDDILDAYGPNVSLQAAGVDLSDIASKRFDKFRRVATKLYNKFETAVANLSRQDIIPTDGVREAASTIEERLRRGKVFQESRTGELGEEIAAGLGKFTTEVSEMLAEFRLLPDTITPAQYREQVKRLGAVLNKGAREGIQFADAAVVKQAFENDLNRIVTDPEYLVAFAPRDEAVAVRKALDDANTWYSRAKTRFETATAKKFGQFDVNIFGGGPFRAGTREADQLAQVVVNLKSPETLKNLSRVVGPKAMKSAAATFISETAEQSIEQVRIGGTTFEVLNPSKLRSGLGLGKRGGGDEGIKFLLKEGGSDPNAMNDVLTLADQLLPIGDPSKFVQRRVVLGGALAGIGAAGAGVALVQGQGAQGAAETGVVWFAVATFLARHLSRLAADPRKLKLMTQALNLENDPSQLRTIWGTLLATLRKREPGEREVIPEVPPGEPVPTLPGLGSQIPRRSTGEQLQRTLGATLEGIAGVR